MSLDFVLEVSLRVVVVGLLGWVVAWALRRRGADVSHAVWVAVLAGMMAMPFITGWAPVLPVVTGVVIMPALVELPGVVGSGPMAEAPLVRAGGVDWGFVAFGVYFAIALMLLARVGWLMRRAWGLAARGVAVSVEAEAEVRESDEVLVPMTVGWRRKVVLLPVGWREWDEFTFRSVMAHEMAHVRRRDWAVAVAAAVNRAMFWCHPQAWWLERRLMGLAEEACDAAAIGEVADARRYAEVVLGFAAAMSGAGSRLNWAATAMARSSRVGGRIERILEGKMNWTRRMTMGGWAALVVAAVPVVYAAGALRTTRQVVLEMPAAAAGLPAAELQQGVVVAQPRTGGAAFQHVEALYLTEEQVVAAEAELERKPED